MQALVVFRLWRGLRAGGGDKGEARGDRTATFSGSAYT